MQCPLYFIKLRSSFDILTRLRAGRPGNCVSIPSRVRDFLFSKAFRPTLEIIQLLSSGYLGLCPWELSGCSVELTIHVCLMPRLKYMELHLHSFIRFHGVVLNHRDNFAFIFYRSPITDDRRTDILNKRDNYCRYFRSTHIAR